MRLLLVAILLVAMTGDASASNLYHALGKISGISSVIQTDDFNFIVMQDHKIQRDVIGSTLKDQCMKVGSELKSTAVGHEIVIPWQGKMVPFKIKSRFDCGTAFSGALFDIVKPGSVNPGAFIRTVQRHPVDPNSQVTVQGVPWLRD